MRTLLVGINAKFIHSNLALYSLKSYCNDREKISIKEFTINNNVNDILKNIYEENPDLIGFSSYIWNIDLILELSSAIKKILPLTKVLLGGPEVSYNLEYIKEKEYIDFIITGEGEESFKKLISGEIELESICNLIYKKSGKIVINKKCNNIDLNRIPFPYSELDIDIDIENKIVYYESTRGCPFSCNFCLSSIDEKVRALNIDRIYEDLKFFLNKKVGQVKFVDRTFNFNSSYAIKIWKCIIENDNGYTNFHFEMAADLINLEMLKVLKEARKGLFQFEIGIQSVNVETLQEINRTNKNNIIFQRVKEVTELKNIHQHLDLIVGLPKENYVSFKKSFNKVYNLEPQKLQIGFLKLLHGTILRNKAETLGLIYNEKAPYEILKTNELSYGEVIKLKGIDKIIDLFYNKERFKNSFKYVISLYETPFDFYESFYFYLQNRNLQEIKHKKNELYTIFYNFAFSNDIIEKVVLIDLFKLDMLINDNLKMIPKYIEVGYDYNIIKKNRNRLYNDINFIENNFNEFVENRRYSKKQIIKLSNIDAFNIDIDKWFNKSEIEIKNNKQTYLLFKYFKLDNENLPRFNKHNFIKIEV